MYNGTVLQITASSAIGERLSGENFDVVGQTHTRERNESGPPFKKKQKNKKQKAMGPRKFGTF